MLHKFYTLFLTIAVITSTGLMTAKTIIHQAAEPAPVLTTVFDDEHADAAEFADRKEREAMRALVDAQEAHDRACKLATTAAAKSQQDALAQAEAAEASRKKALGAQNAATTILMSRNERNQQ